MKLLILVVLLSSAYCSENYDQDGIENKERPIAGGGNFGGFIGLTTYGSGPFLVKGKIERVDNENNYKKTGRVDNEKDNKGVSKTYDEGNDREYESETNRDGKKDDDLEYLGYRGARECTRENSNGYKDYSDDEVKNRCDRLFGFTGPTANDEPENLVRPCALDDWQCIRKYFAANSNCKPAYGPIPDPLYIDVSTAFLPVINLTVTLPNLMVRGLSTAKIREFYVNKRSGNLVLAIDLSYLNLTIPRAYFRYRRTAKESIVLADYGTAAFRAITFTAVIPNIPYLRLDLADIHADVQDATPVFFVGPGAANSTDPDVVTAFAELNLFLPFAIREAFLFLSQLLTSIYIQENICDFGLKIVSV